MIETAEEYLQHHHLQHRGKWGSSLEFILTVIGYAVGLGNVWRFPFLVFKNGGAAFLVPFFLLLFLVGIPTFFLEASIGQFSGYSPIHAFDKMVPLFKGLGYAQVFVNGCIGFYYNVIIAYSLYYLTYSVRTELPWKSCGDVEDCFTRKNLSGDCNLEKQEFLLKNITNVRSPSEVYFYDKVLELSDGIQNFGGLNLHLAVALFISWSIVFVAISKGVQSLGKISYFTSTFPYLILTVLVIKGLTLDGAGKGIEFYVGRFEIARLAQPELWKDAAVQIFFALSSCTGGIITMASFNDFDNNILRDSLLVPILDIFTGFYAGFAIFSVLGYMYLTKCATSFAEVAAQGPELAFVVYPEGISLMGIVAPLFSVLFFVMMLSLGFGTEFSIMEAVISAVIDLFHEKINNKMKRYMLRFAICLSLFLLGLVMVTRNGLFVLNLIDYSISGYPLLVLGLLQIIVVVWIYGADKFKNDIECMIGKKPDWFWKIWMICWKYICPIVLIVILIATIIMPTPELNLRGITYPTGAKAIGWIIAAIPALILLYYGIRQAITYEFNWKLLLSPDDSYYNNYKRHLFAEKQRQSSNAVLKQVDSMSDKVGAFENKSYIDDARIFYNKDSQDIKI